MSVQFNPNFGITKEEWDKLSPAEQQSKADAFNAAEQAKLTAGLAGASDTSNKGFAVQKGPKANTTTETKVTYAKADIEQFDPRVQQALVEQGVLIADGENFKLADGKNLQEAINAEYAKLPTLMKIPPELKDKIPEGMVKAVDGQENVYEVENDKVAELQQKLGLTKEDGSPAEGVTKSEPEEQPGGKFAVSKTTTSTTTVHNEEIPIPDGVMLKDDKNARKGLQKQYEAKLEEWVKDPQNKALMDYSIAQMKYGKKVDKEAQKLAKKDDFNLYAAYYNMCDKRMQAIIDADTQKFLDDDKNIKTIMHEYNKQNPSHQITDEAAFKEKPIASFYARKYVLEEAGIHKDDILNMVAANNVLQNRDADKIESDQKWFIENMAKREVEMRRDKQIFENTVPHFSKADKNAAKKDGTQDPNKIHTDIGKSGRKLVEKSFDINPEMFCTEMQDGIGSLTAKQMEERGIFEKNGKYYQFDGNKWQQFFLRGSDSRYDEGQFQDQFTEDFHTTLTEARQEWLAGQEDLIDASGRMYSLDDLIGDGDGTAGSANGKVGNRELNRYNGMAKTAGIHHDTNTTVMKRFLHIGKGALIGGATGTAAVLAPWYLAMGVGLAGTTADQLISYHGRTEDQIINGVAKGQVTTTDYYTDKYGTTSVTHITDVDVPYQDVAPGQDYSGQVKAEGQDWKADPTRTAATAGVLGAVVGGLKNALTANHVEAKGTKWDHVIDLSSDKVLKPEREEINEGITTPPRYITTFDVTITEEKDLEKLPAVRWRAPEAYSGLYQYEDGTPVKAQDFQKAYRELTGVNTMTKHYFYVFPELMINGKKVVLKNNYREEYKNIKIGVNGNVKDVAYNGKTSSTTSARVIKNSP